MLMLALVAWWVAGCSRVERFDAEGALVERAVTLGPARLPARPDVALERQAGLGLAWGDGRGFVGWFSYELRRVADDCQAVIVVRGAEEARRVMALARGIAGVCIMEESRNAKNRL